MDRTRLIGRLIFFRYFFLVGLSFLDKFDLDLEVSSRNTDQIPVLYNYKQSKLTRAGISLKFRELLQRWL